jgi:chromosome segregation ATPase
MKTKQLPTMRDIPTIQGLKNRAVPSNREQIASELARLEHEKARLERELNMWVGNQKKTKIRIHQVQERLDLLEHVMDELSPRHSSELDEFEKENGKYKEVTLEY